MSKFDKNEGGTKSEGSSTNLASNFVPVPLDFKNSETGVWLVKVPKYLANKWNSAMPNSEVGRIKITKYKSQPNAKPEVSFHLNEKMPVDPNIPREPIDDRFAGAEIIPLEHKFLLTQQQKGQDVFILRQDDTETAPNLKEALSIIGKVSQRAECNPIKDTSYLNLKRETQKKLLAPQRKMMTAENNLIKKHFLPKSNHSHNLDKKNTAKRLRKDKMDVREMLFNAFTRHQFYNIKDLERLTQQPINYLKDILHEICQYNIKGLHKNTWELKDEYRQGNSESTGTASRRNNDDDDDEEMDDDDEDNDEMIEHM